MKEIKQILANNIKNARKAKHYTQAQLAQKLGVNIRQLARIEAGSSFVSAETLKGICLVLEISPKDLFDEKLEVLPPQNPEYAKLTKHLDNISDDKFKIEFLNLVIKSLDNKDALNELQLILKGFELRDKILKYE